MAIIGRESMMDAKADPPFEGERTASGIILATVRKRSNRGDCVLHSETHR